MFLRAFTAIALTAALGGCANAYEPGPQLSYGRTDILDRLPADAPPGECYARVKVPGGAVQGPPQVTGAQWVMMPGPPGAPGPIWCLVQTAATPVAFEPDRYGFIRVLCEDELTGPRVSGIQRQLHSRGYYSGGFTGRYDTATAAAVAQFQAGANIAHGGYMSFETAQALEGGYASQGYASGGYSSQAYGYQQSASYGGGFAPPWNGSPCLNPCAMPAPPPPPPPPPPPCCVVYTPPPCPTLCGPGYGAAVGYSGTVAYPAQPYAQSYAQAGGYAQQGYVQQGYGGGYAGGIGYGPLGGGVGYGYQAGYAGGAYYSQPSYAPPMPAYAAAAASARASAQVTGGFGGATASATARAQATYGVRNGWLTWGGR